MDGMVDIEGIDILGTSAPDIISGDGGMDLLLGLRGDDTLSGAGSGYDFWWRWGRLPSGRRCDP